jgi:ABC-type Na+ transport system ATPase subunit NatA
MSAQNAATDALANSKSDGVAQFVVNLTQEESFHNPVMLASSPQHCDADCLQEDNMTSYLLRTSTFDDTCHGGLSANAFNRSDINIVESWIRRSPTHVRGAKGAADAGFALSGWFNSRDSHSLPAYINYANNVLFKWATGSDHATIRTKTHPISSNPQFLLFKSQQLPADQIAGILAVVALTMSPANTLSQLTTERIRGVAHLQVTSGAPPSAYWFSNWIWDFTTYAVAPIITAALVLPTFKVAAYSGANLGTIFGLMLLYGWAMVPFAHVLARFSKEPARAYLGLITGSSFIAITGGLGDFALGMFGTNPASSTALLRITLNQWLALLPPYSLALGMVKVAANEHRTLFYRTKNDQSASSAANEALGDTPISTPGSWDVSGRYMFMMFAEGFVFLTASLLWDMWAQWKRERDLRKRKTMERAASAAASADDWVVLDGDGNEGDDVTIPTDANGLNTDTNGLNNAPCNGVAAAPDDRHAFTSSGEDKDIIAERQRVNAYTEHRTTAAEYPDDKNVPPYSLMVQGFTKVYASQNRSSRQIISPGILQGLVALAGIYIGISLLFFDALLMALLPPIVVGWLVLIIKRRGTGCIGRLWHCIRRSCRRSCKRGNGKAKYTTISSHTHPEDNDDEDTDDEDTDDEDDEIANTLAAPTATTTHPNGTTPRGTGRVVAAVSDLTFGIQPGECFGLLGVNGAGKTTLFKGLTGGLRPTSGTIEVAGHDVEAELATASGSLGYCPQHDALCEFLTCLEHMQLYGHLYDMPTATITTEAIKRLAALGLDKFANRPAGELSYGNRRKLSLAIAMFGDRPLLCLDEPSSGMDPQARRELRVQIQAYAKAGRAVLLTSHAMDECTCSFFDRNPNSRMPLSFTPLLRLKRCHACDQ